MWGYLSEGSSIVALARSKNPLCFSQGQEMESRRDHECGGGSSLMSCSMSSGADGAPEKPQKASRDGNIRRESAVPIEERNLTPEVLEQRAGAESERQR